MRHRDKTTVLGRKKPQRTALLRGLLKQFFMVGKITTTEQKCKVLRSQAEQMITLAKKPTLQTRRRLLQRIQDPKVVALIMDTVASRYKDRNSGYVRLTRAGRRKGDRAPISIIEFV